ncbi:MAG: DegT/DnrJ/EryC1/StrS family aminotransferase [Planctomycetes bacterium]|nr:DegT/DnrJ/EryC1/StrS family aminotransferase [Planctomycetota bacterium]
MQVPVLELKAQYASMKDDILEQINEVLDAQWVIGGPKVEDLEKRIAKLSECKFAVGVSSGTDAILNSLMSLDIGPGDEVITTPFTFFATGGCIARTGAKPVFVDIDEKTYNIDPTLIEAAVTDNTKAIMPVHLYGQMADMEPIMRIAGIYGLAVIEDAAQSISSTYNKKPAGSIGTTGCFSFYPSKNLGGIGDGGMVVTNDERLYQRLKVMRNHGQTGAYEHKYIGGNFRLDAIQAAALLIKLKHLGKWSAARRKNAAYYNKKLADSPVTIPYIDEQCVSIYNQYVIRVPNRDKVFDHLRNNDVGCMVYYPMPLHMQECFAYLGYKEGDLPVAEKAAKEVMALPVYPELTNEMQDYAIKSILDFL